MMKLGLVCLLTVLVITVSSFPLLYLLEGFAGVFRALPGPDSVCTSDSRTVFSDESKCAEFNIGNEEGSTKPLGLEAGEATLSGIRNKRTDGNQLGTGFEGHEGLIEQVLLEQRRSVRPGRNIRRAHDPIEDEGKVKRSADDSPNEPVSTAESKTRRPTQAADKDNEDNEDGKTTKTANGDPPKTRTLPSESSESATSMTSPSSKPSSSPTSTLRASTTILAAVTVTVTPTSSSTALPPSKGMNGGSIAAASIFSFIVIASISFLLFICLRRSKRDYAARRQRRQSGQSQRLLSDSAKPGLSDMDTVNPLPHSEEMPQKSDTSSMFSRSSTSSHGSHGASPLYIPLQTVQRPRTISGGLYPLGPFSPEIPDSATPMTPSAAFLGRGSIDLSSRYNPASARRSVSYQGQMGRPRMMSRASTSDGSPFAPTAGKVPSREPSVSSQLSFEIGSERRHTKGSSIPNLHAQS